MHGAPEKALKIYDLTFAVDEALCKPPERRDGPLFIVPQRLVAGSRQTDDGSVQFRILMSKFPVSSGQAEESKVIVRNGGGLLQRFAELRRRIDRETGRG